jgi:hypothetical protein
MRRLRTFVPLIIMLVCLTTTHERSRTERQDDVKDFGFPFVTLIEQLRCGIGPPTWQASIEMPRAQYSRENLDRLFRFYSLRHVNMSERICVKVYAGPMQHLVDDRTAFNTWERRGDAAIVRWDAIFFREGDGIGAAGRNEYYSYRPNLDNTDENVVILKGTLINRSKKVVETWRTSHAGIEIRVLAYYLEGVDPPGIYYTFQSFDSDWSEWQSIMTVRQDEQVPVPKDSVVFFGDATGYAHMGSLYAVTVDGGKHWSVWDAERDFETGRWCEHWLIEKVEITTSGQGSMVLVCVQADDKWVLKTSNFGQNWKPS